MDLDSWVARVVGFFGWQTLSLQQILYPVNQLADKTSLTSYYNSFQHERSFDELDWLERCEWNQRWQHAKHEKQQSTEAIHLIQKIVGNANECLYQLNFMFFDKKLEPSIYMTGFPGEDNKIMFHIWAQAKNPSFHFECFRVLSITDYFKLLFLFKDITHHITLNRITPALGYTGTEINTDHVDELLSKMEDELGMEEEVSET